MTDKKVKEYIQAFHKEYLSQQKLEPTTENIAEFSVDESQLKLLYEDKYTWVVLNDGDREGKWVNVIWKEEDRRMETIEL